MAGNRTIRLRIEIQADINKLNAGLRSLSATTQDLGNKSAQATDKIDKGFNQASRSISNFQRGLRDVGRNLSLYVTLPLALAGRQALQAASQIDFAFAEVRSILDENERSLSPGIMGAIKQIAADFPQQVVNITQGFKEIISSSISAADAMKIIGPASKLATGGFTDVSTGVDALITIIQAYGKSANESEHISEILFNTVKRGRIPFNELNSSMAHVISTAALAKVDVEELMGAMAGLSLTGLKAETAAFSLNQAMLAYIKPNTDAITVAKEFGVELSAQALRSQGLVKSIKVLVDLFDRVESQGGDAVKVIADLMPEIRGLRAVASLVGPAFENFVNITQEMRGELHGLDYAVGVASDTLQGKWTQVVEAAKLAAYDFALALGGGLKDGLDYIKQVFEGISNLSPETKKVILSIGLIVVALGPLVQAIRGLIWVFGILGLSRIPMLIKSIGALGTAFTASGPLGWILGGTAALGIAIYKLIDAYRDHDKQVNEFIDSVTSSAFRVAISSLVDVLDSIFKRDRLSSIEEHNEALVKYQGIWEGIYAITGAAKDVINSIFDRASTERLGAHVVAMNDVLQAWRKLEEFNKQVAIDLSALRGAQGEQVGPPDSMFPGTEQYNQFVDLVNRIFPKYKIEKSALTEEEKKALAQQAQMNAELKVQIGLIDESASSRKRALEIEIDSLNKQLKSQEAILKDPTSGLYKINEDWLKAYTELKQAERSLDEENRREKTKAEEDYLKKRREQQKQDELRVQEELAALLLKQHQAKEEDKFNFDVAIAKKRVELAEVEAMNFETPYLDALQGIMDAEQDLIDTEKELLDLRRELWEKNNSLISLGIREFYAAFSEELFNMFDKEEFYTRERLALDNYELQQREQTLRDQLRNAEISQQEYNLRVSDLNRQRRQNEQQYEEEHSGAITRIWKRVTQAYLDELQERLSKYLGDKTIEMIMSQKVETVKTAAATVGTTARVGLATTEIAADTAVQGSAFSTMFAKISAFYSSLGPFAIPAILATVGGIMALFGSFKSGLKLAQGGLVGGQGTATSDSNPAMLSKGEYVVNARATRDNLPLLESLNSGMSDMFSRFMPGFAQGGLVGGPLPSMAGNTNALQYELRMLRAEMREYRPIVNIENHAELGVKDTQLYVLMRSGERKVNVRRLSSN